ncbi:uncharacterized protein SPPG_09452 [Spizellomyces punctatus DAOM BR117]|uniref:F-box domain-containing protein n=1 Tax=Spizellomyces punctatus (strain DAOM BR117) TaxID=645134 RepID=A0A0L0H7R6_SPIPD|nr:uncharacterized protein SPPG_09452 [Spizellomyces punctatus DAOM BR117]KNC97267.1 hypothetical protein SPPG_09452 [Spizellomyces punctatus DAOM BR117]|eukprot:XP_016605307.1 hypothetical protein SPPG_09452 [Spizellomyces punctatus DAOM BR117]
MTLNSGQRLPNEIIIHILNFCNVHTLRVMETASKEMRQLVNVAFQTLALSIWPDEYTKELLELTTQEDPAAFYVPYSNQNMIVQSVWRRYYDHRTVWSSNGKHISHSRGGSYYETDWTNLHGLSFLMKEKTRVLEYHFAEAIRLIEENRRK